MINANELRLGNWINWETYKGQDFGPEILKDVITEPIRVDTNILVSIGYGATHYFPIPLTPGILEKAGFTVSINQPTIHLLRIGDTNFMLINRKEGRFYFLAGSIPCQYVHQLQNLLFALTGEELQIEL